jgi:hypothetical protein
VNDGETVAAQVKRVLNKCDLSLEFDPETRTHVAHLTQILAFSKNYKAVDWEWKIINYITVVCYDYSSASSVAATTAA